MIKCYDCGASISDQAIQCPKCMSCNIKGVNCELCGKLMKASASAMRDTATYKYIHKRCGANLFGHKGRCYECGCTLWGGWGSDWTSDLMLSLSDSFDGHILYRSCRKCGAPNPLKYRGTCSICKLSVYEQLHPVSTTGVKHLQCEKRLSSESE